MLRLDPKDPLDRMLKKELRGETVSFDEWLDFEVELAEEPDFEAVIRQTGCNVEDLFREAEEYRKAFYRRLAAHGIQAHDRFTLCRQLSERALAEPSRELLELYCEVLCDPGFLLGPPEEALDACDANEIREQTVLQYLSFQVERDALIQMLTRRGHQARQLEAVKKIRRGPPPADCDTQLCYPIFQCFSAHFDLPGEENGAVLLDNLALYLQIAEASPDLKSVEPLFLFRLLTLQSSRMCRNEHLDVYLPALWRQDTGNVSRDNGKNFKTWRRNLGLFKELCGLFERDPAVDLPLCWYGLDRVTVLGDFYREQMEDPCDDTQTETLPFPPTIKELVEDRVFSCFPQGYGDNVLLEDSGLTVDDLMDFERSANFWTSKALDKISQYMNSHAADLTNRFLYADREQVKTLCGDILEGTHLPAICQPQDAHEVSLYLAAINEGIMELVDYYASQFLILAGCALTGEHPTDNSGPTESCP